MVKNAVVIGGGPAGLMAAEVLSHAGIHVNLYDAMPSVGRKFLMAGRGGLNLTHAEPGEKFLSRYDARRSVLEPWIRAFGPEQLRAWANDLGVETFVGTSQRVFPMEMKAAPLLRRWLSRLRASGVTFHMRHRWVGWNNDALHFETPTETIDVHADAIILALGGGSWARLGSDGAWVQMLRGQGIDVRTLRPANCGFDVAWSDHFKERFAGSPVKPVSIAIAGSESFRRGEFVVTANGVEGSLIYALSAPARDIIETHGTAVLHLDLIPKRSATEVTAAVARPRGKASMATYLRKQLGLDGVRAGLLRELASPEDLADPRRLAAIVKALPVTLFAPRPIDEVISTAGGLAFEALDPDLMVQRIPGVFCAGEMLDWEAPTGGYLLTACFATGRAAGLGAVKWLDRALTKTEATS
jgi:uncharacterized flavoprotein (TIGR03862 family)